MEHLPSTPLPAINSGMYWRKSKLFGHLCPPGILSLSNGKLAFISDDGLIFNVPVAETSAAYSGWGTLTVRARGTAYDFLGTAGAMARPFSTAQKAQLTESARRGAPAGGSGSAGTSVGTVSDSAVTTLAQVVGSTVLAGDYSSGAKVLRQWPAALAEAGATVTTARGNYLWWFFGVIAAGLAIAATIVGVVGSH